MLTPSQLNDICETAVATAYANDNYYRYYYDFLLKTGSRPQDALRINYYVNTVDDNAIFQPSKNNNSRGIPISDINLNMANYYFNAGTYLKSYWYTRVNRDFNRLLWPTRISTLKKNSVLYLFRYNFVRQLYENGATVEEIRDKMGWTNTGIVYSYLLKNLS